MAVHGPRQTPIRVPRPRRVAPATPAVAAGSDREPAPAPPPADARPQRTATARADRRRRWPAILVGVLGALVVAAAISPGDAPPETRQDTAATTPIRSAPEPRPATYEMHGLVSLAGPVGVLVSDSDTVDGTNDPACWGQRQYRDILHGTVVTVLDDRGRTLAHGGLGRGRAGSQQVAGLPVASCVFPIYVDAIPSDAASYRVKIAGRDTFVVKNAAVNGVLYAYVALDDDPTATPPNADLPPQIPHPAVFP